MADAIPSDMLDAIAAYRGPVTICPPRTFALSIDPVPLRQQINRDRQAAYVARAARQAEIGRKNKLLVFSAALRLGTGVDRICGDTGLSRSTVGEHIRALRAEGKLAPATKGPAACNGQLTAQIVALADGTRTVFEVIAALDRPRAQKTIYSTMRRLRDKGIDVKLKPAVSV